MGLEKKWQEKQEPDNATSLLVHRWCVLYHRYFLSLAKPHSLQGSCYPEVCSSSLFSIRLFFLWQTQTRSRLGSGCCPPPAVFPRIPGSITYCTSVWRCTHEHIKQLNAKLLLREEQPRCWWDELHWPFPVTCHLEWPEGSFSYPTETGTGTSLCLYTAAQCEPALLHKHRTVPELINPLKW